MKIKFFQSAVSLILIAAFLMSSPAIIFASITDKQANNLFFAIQSKPTIKISVVEYKSDKFIFNFTKNDEKIGTAQFARNKDGHSTIFRDNLNEEFALIVKPNANQDKSSITLKYNEIQETISFAQFRGSSKLSVNQQEKIETIISKTRSNESFSQMMTASKRISQSNTLLNMDGLECTKEVFGCIAAAIAWLGSVSALIAACPESLGLTCVGALVAHQVLGGVAATQCAWAMKVCQKKPSSFSDQIEIMVEMNDF